MVSEQRRKELKTLIEKRVYDIYDPYACKIEPLKDRNIPELASKEREKNRK